MTTTDYEEALIILAEMLNKARIQANAIEVTAPQRGVYGNISNAFIKTLQLLLPLHLADAVYDSVLDGNTVREALTILGV